MEYSLIWAGFSNITARNSLDNDYEDKNDGNVLFPKIKEKRKKRTKEIY